MFKIEAGISNITIIDFPSIIKQLNAEKEKEKAKPKGDAKK